MAENKTTTPKREYSLIERLHHAEKVLEGAKTPTERSVAQSRLDNLIKMLSEDFDYGKFASGGKVYRGRSAQGSAEKS